MKRTIEENKAYCEKYPFLKLDPSIFNYKYTWEDQISEGWRKVFCPQIWDELLEILKKYDYVNEFRFSDIKEKYGTLRIYTFSLPVDIFDEIQEWIDKYENLSMQFCINCGKPATCMTKGYTSFLCKDCAEESQLHFIEI